MVNSQTLQYLRHYCVKYATWRDRDHSRTTEFANQRTALLGNLPPQYRHQGHYTLVRSFAPRITGGVTDIAMMTAEHLFDRFWKTGRVEPLAKPKDPNPKDLANPLLMFSSSGRDYLTITYRTHPLESFHLAASFTDLTPDSAFYQGPDEGNKVPDDLALEMGKAQFDAWCKAFKQVARDSKSRLRLRFFIGDALNFCLALQHRLKNPTAPPLNIYPGPWSSQPLQLDSADYDSQSADRAPSSFNVIETSNLADDVGLLNLLVSTTPLLAAAPSVLYTETLKPPAKDSPNLLAELLCGADISTMCTLLGLVPDVYLTGVSTRVKDEATVDDVTPALSRISLKIATSIDPNINPTEARLSCEPKQMAKFLFNIYLKMFFHETQAYLDQMSTPAGPSGRVRFSVPHYSRASFVAFLAFLKSRISLNWEELVSTLLQHIQRDRTLIDGDSHMSELKLLLYLYGVADKLVQHNPDAQQQLVEQVMAATLGGDDIGCLIVTIPRSRLVNLYQACLYGLRAGNIVFQMCISGSSKHVFTSTQSIFGKLRRQHEQRSGATHATIDVDSNGWHGNADLHVCALIPIELYMMDVVTQGKKPEISIVMQKDRSTMLYVSSFGLDLEVFRCKLDDDAQVKLVDNFPGFLKIPTRIMKVTPVEERPLVSNDAYDLSCPLLKLEDRALTSTLTFKGAELELFKSGISIDSRQISPCVLQIKLGEYSYRCPFPFPFVGKEARVRVSRKEGRIEIIPFLFQPIIEGRCPENPFPLILNKSAILDSPPDLWTWNLPYLNFHQLPHIAHSSFNSLRQTMPKIHLETMLSHFEFHHDHRDDSLTLREFKNSVRAFFLCCLEHSKPNEPYILPICSPRGLMEEGGPLIFFITGLYFDSNARSMVIDASVVVMAKSRMKDTKFRGFVERAENYSPGYIKQDLGMWKRSLPAMAERCRDWEHTATCEYKDGMLNKFDIENYPLCSCGVGKVGMELKQSRWKDGVPFLTRVAIPTFFPISWLEKTRPGPLEPIDPDRNDLLHSTKLTPVLKRIEELGEKMNMTATEAQLGNPNIGSELDMNIVEEQLRNMNLESESRSTVPNGPGVLKKKPEAKGVDRKEAKVKVKVNDTTPPEAAGARCIRCGKTPAKKCGACGKVYYCGRECQKLDWKSHKTVCKKAQEERPKTG